MISVSQQGAWQVVDRPDIGGQLSELQRYLLFRVAMVMLCQWMGVENRRRGACIVEWMYACTSGRGCLRCECLQRVLHSNPFTCAANILSSWLLRILAAQVNGLLCRTLQSTPLLQWLCVKGAGVVLCGVVAKLQNPCVAVCITEMNGT